MPVQINITGSDAAESLRELSALSAGLLFNTQAAATVAAPIEDKPKRNRPTKSETKQETAAELEGKKIDLDKLTEEDNTADSADAGDDVEIPSDVDLRAAAAEKAGVVGKAKIKALLDKYGVSNVTAIPDDKRVAFLQELGELS